MGHVKARHTVARCGYAMNAPLCHWTGGRTEHCEFDDCYWWDCPKAETVTEYFEGDFNFIEIENTSTFHNTEYALKLGNKRPGKRVYRCSYLEIDGHVYCDRDEGAKVVSE